MNRVFFRRDPWRLPISSRALVFACTKGGPPAGGWNSETFKREGERLLTGLVAVGKTVTKRAGAAVAKLFAQEFREAIDAIVETGKVRIAISRGRRSPGDATDVKAEEIELSLPGDEGIWAQALDDVLRARLPGFTARAVPPLISVGTQAVTKTGTALGLDLSDLGSHHARGERSKIGLRIRNIDETTREKFRAIIGREMAERRPVVAVADALKREMRGFSDRRLQTIARTETQSAWTRGTVAALQATPDVTHVSVIGCESRELSRWGSPSYQQFMFRGESTCNIVDVPIADADKLNFHPNHTGAVVPSRFRDPQDIEPTPPGTENPNAPKEPEWKPSMTKDEAAAFTAGTALDRREFFLFTSAKKLATAAADGLEPWDTVLGKGVRVIGDPFGGLDAIGAERRATAAVRALKPAKFGTAFEAQSWVDTFDPGSKDLIGSLKKHGFDSILIEPPAGSRRLPWVVAFEKRQVVLIEGSSIDIAATKPKPTVPKPALPKPKPAVIVADPAKPPPKPLAAGEGLSPSSMISHVAFKDPEVRAAVKEALDDLDRTLKVPHAVKTTFKRTKLAENTAGDYVFSQIAGGATIRSNSTFEVGKLASTLFHEWGHLMDEHFLAVGVQGGRFASRVAVRTIYNTPPVMPHLRTLVAFFEKSDALKRLRGAASARHVAYASTPHEVWARAFQQWMAEKSGNKMAIEAVAKRTPEGSFYTPDEWQAVRPVVELALRAANLLRE